MSPRTEKQFEEIREEKKKLIMDTALELFANNGYHNTSIGEIAKKAGISKGLIYNYFDSKEQLLQAIVFWGFDEFAQFFDPNHDGILEKQELHYMLEGMFKLIKEKTHMWKLYFSIALQPQVLNVIEEEAQIRAIPYLKLLEGYFERQGRKNPYLEARFFAAITDGIIMQYVLDPENFPFDESLQKLIAMYK